MAALPRPGTADESLAQFCAVLDAVEDEMSGAPKSDPPPATGDGRMYCPLPDRTQYLADGSIEAVTTGHTILVGRDGQLTVTRRSSGEVEFIR
ncbi:hypothetical protein [Mycolicibacterium conceptionense]|uniref:hypothetical protein n=1 Tax=Mycolicibacterium conceptionense TaxID=451644 RepID=UPI00103D24D5|nr:hypothetical protein [Mycolicibacterium conceptionense]